MRTIEQLSSKGIKGYRGRITIRLVTRILRIIAHIKPASTCGIAFRFVRAVTIEEITVTIRGAASTVYYTGCTILAHTPETALGVT